MRAFPAVRIYRHGRREVTTSLMLPRRFTATPRICCVSDAEPSDWSFFLVLLLRRNSERLSRSVPAADAGLTTFISFRTFIGGCGLISRLLGGLGMVAPPLFRGMRSAWLVRGLGGPELAYADEGVDVKVGRGDPSLSIVLLRRRMNFGIFLPSVRAGEGDVRLRGDVTAVARDAAGESVRLDCSSPSVTVRLPDELER